jgi:glutathione-regulated potassium-efflux system ancillary protein KefF
VLALARRLHGARLFRYGNGMTSFPTTTQNPAAHDIYVIAAHPAWRESRVNRPMMEAAQASPRTRVQDLYSSYPDYAIDVPAEQAAMTQASLIVLLHPIQWYSMPALQKLWMDEVLTYGWAYGDEGSALQGKDLWLVATTGGPEDSYHPQGYNRYFFDAFLPPYEQSAALCGMRFLPPLILHGAHSVDAASVAQHLQTFRERLQSYPDWPEMDELEQCAACVVPMNDRPKPDPAVTRPSFASTISFDDEESVGAPE